VAETHKIDNVGGHNAPDEVRSNVIDDSLFEICSANIAIKAAKAKFYPSK
jgi:hypothetical protein